MFKVLLKSVFIGIANIIPGVSGGTLAVVLGLYEKLTGAVSGVISDPKQRLNHIKFLAVVLVGAGAGIVVFARIFRFLLSQPSLAGITYLFFAGLIIGSIPLLLSLSKGKSPLALRAVIFVIAGAAVILAAVFFGTGSSEATVVSSGTGGFINFTLVEPLRALWLFICGFFSAAAMVVPGFSGSALLLSLGEYANILVYVDDRMVIPLAAIALGILPGIWVAARLMSFLLARFPSQTYAMIMGFVAASLYEVGQSVIAVWIWTPLTVVGGILSLAAGIACAWFFGRSEASGGI